ncbi:MAG: lysine exporter LysO family protein, partial [[Eubacterium] sulci]|nr:lysine exporter LysO family protein [[Eubacterium] sulci]
MRDFIIYVILAAIGYFIGSKLRHKKEKLAWTGKFQTVAIVLLVLTMGSRMGANDEVIENLGSIGVYSLVVTVVILVFSIIAVFLARKVLRIDRHGLLISADKPMDAVNKEENSNVDGGKIDKMTLIIIASVILGLICGYALVDKVFDSYDTFNTMAGHAIQIGLCILLSLVGLDLGLDGTVIDNFRKVGLRVLIFPFAIAIGSLAGAFICGLILPLSVKEMLAVGAGFGWYSLAPGIILEAGLAQASAVAFMHNVMREILGIIFIPLVAK